MHAHVLDQIRLEDLSLASKSPGIAFTRLFPVSNVLFNFFSSVHVLYAKAVEEEHPLVHLELIDV